MDDKTTSGGSDTDSQSSSEDADTGKSLATLLAEWDDGSGTIDKDASTEDSELKELRKEVAELRQAEGERSYKAEMSDFVIPEIKGDLDVDPEIVEWWVNKQADEHPQLKKVWNERFDRRADFKKAIEALKPEFAKYAQSKVLPRKSDDGLVAAVNGAKETNVDLSKHENLDLDSMSDQELALKEEEIFRAYRGGSLK